MINKFIFRGYDIRGIYGEDLTEEVATLVGKAYGTFIQDNGEKNVIVGMDNRTSSPSLKQALVEGILSTGANVIDIGLVTTPIYYYSRVKYSVKPGIMVTASHNPSEYNGFKMSSYDDERMYGNQLQWFRAFIDKGAFLTGKGAIRQVNPIPDYINDVVSKCKLGDRKLKVVIDCGNASGGLVAEDVLKGIGCEVIPLYCDLDSKFPNHHPDPAKPENMQDLVKKVLEEKADLGIGLDGDADRVGIVDEKGHIMFGDEYQMVMLQEILPKYPGVKVPVEIKCTYALYEQIEKLGGIPFYHRTGNACLYQTIKDMNLPFVAEMSGHVFYADENYGYDDGLYAGCRFIRFLSNTNKKVSELLNGVNKYHTTPEMMIKTTDAIKFEQIDRIKEYFENKGYEIVDVDGARIIFDDGWGLIRASNTSPNLTMRCESRTIEGLERIKGEIELALKEIEK